MTDYPLSAVEVADAAKRLQGVAKETVLEHSERLSKEVGVDVYLKREDLQLCRSFKVRGAYNKIASLTPEQQKRGVVCASAGNHAQGVAYACAALQIHGKIFLPSNTPRQKRDRIKTIGGKWIERVIVNGGFDQANELARTYAETENLVFVPPYDDPLTIAGQGTIGVELSAQMPANTDTVVVPIGGGGLAAGIALWLKTHHPKIRVVGVEPAGAASAAAARRAGKPVTIKVSDNFVDGTAVGRVGDTPFEFLNSLLDDVVIVPEGAVCSQMLALYNAEGIIAEPAGALAAAAIHGYLPHQPQGPVIGIVSGGNNDLSRYAEVQERSLLHEGLRHYFLVTFSQEPGALRRFLEDVLGHDQDIVHFEYTKKNNRDTGPALVGIDIVSPQDLADLLKRIDDSPLHVEHISPDSEIFRLLV
ncbi:threonine ammonia-lyase IlvA [Gleimia sp. 6138-11-ORH1]|uniref:threonine ammonia-lyase IlvA n=1 Tax=Gleimia sp. 6138-11-ORH1 TaxID=2973937 RepID=UPI00216773C1|nr:threonine ammonia-lyase IlvA [Gleimia sp. 6138-11-ORH1]MCS4484916.1 threonine ammonia-lyase IlvA [Gleimia sp. 6138-11-ORH1]